jgi:hypothetical protein
MKFLAADQLIYMGDPLEQFNFIRKKASLHPSLTYADQQFIQSNLSSANELT